MIFEIWKIFYIFWYLIKKNKKFKFITLIEIKIKLKIKIIYLKNKVLKLKDKKEPVALHFCRSWYNRLNHLRFIVEAVDIPLVEFWGES